MAKTLHSDVYDGGLNVVKNNVTNLVFCSSQPGNYAGIAAVTLVSKTGMTSGGSFTGPAADGPTKGRQLTINAITGMSPSANGTVTYAVLTDGLSRILAGTTVTPQAVSTGQSWDSPAFDVTFPAPV